MGRSRVLSPAFVLILFSVNLVFLARGYASAEVIKEIVRIESVEGKRFGFPCDVAVDSRGFFYVLDSLNKSVSIIGHSGKFSKYVPLDKKHIEKPEGIDVKFPGAFVIADSGRSSVIEFDVSGKKGKEWKIPSAGRIVDVAVHGKMLFALDGRKGSVYILEANDDRVQEFGGYGDHSGELKSPFRIFVDRSGKAYISDVMNARIQIFDVQGKSLGEIKKFGLSLETFMRPGGVCSNGYEMVIFSDMVSGFIFSYDSTSKDIEVFRSKAGPVKFLDPVSVNMFEKTIGVVDQRDRSFNLLQF